MAFVILILFAFFGFIALRQQMTRNSVNAGENDAVIKKLLSRYKMLREHQNEIGTNAFVIGKAQKCSGKSLRDDPDALSVRILDEKGRRRDGAAALGMDVIELNDKFYYQFPVELDVRMKDAELAAILARTKAKIEERYPDDFVGRAVDYITVVIDGKKVLSHIQES